MARGATIQVDEEDIPFEEEVQKNRYSLKGWIRYLEHKNTASCRVRNLIHERALKELPGSYKLWHQYLTERMRQAKNYNYDHKQWELANQTFERSLLTMYKMPCIWEMYCEFLAAQKYITRTRKTFDRALKSLPVTQHKRIWNIYLPWAMSTDIPETSLRIFRRGLKIDETLTEDFVNFLLQIEHYAEAAELLANAVNDPKFKSKQGKSKHQLWLDLCEMLSKFPECGKRLDVEGIIRQGIEQFSDQVGRLWTSLANYYIRQNNFEKVRDVFEEGLSSVMNLRDLIYIWEAYTQFEDSIITSLLQSGDDLLPEQKIEMELRVARYEYLIDRRPLLVNSVKLRQNPNDVKEWHERIKLYKNPHSIIETYQRALKTVDPIKAKGKPHTLWINFAKYYHQHGDLDETRKIFETAVTKRFKTMDHLASIWCEYIEIELINRNYTEARSLIKRATEQPANWHLISKNFNQLSVQQKLFKSTRLWGFYADIEESLGNFESTKAIYERILSLHVATPQIIINYAHFLEEHNYFEDSFKAYEKGVYLFKFPFSLDIWLVYLEKFVRRYGGSKMERTRDLFERAIDTIPSNLAKIIYIQYAEVEEEYGFVRHAMNIYDRATRAVADTDKYSIYQLYIARATEFFGVTRSREIYEKAIQSLPEEYIIRMCIQYADLECKLGEIDRARAIYTHCSQYSDPRSNNEFWNTWREFEVRHGNVDTFREMLRVRRSVQAQYNTQVNFVLAQMNESNVTATPFNENVPASLAANAGELGKRKFEQLDTVDDDARPVIPIQSLESRFQPDARQNPLAGQALVSNEEEINLDDEDEDGPVTVELKPVPAAVFGSAKVDEVSPASKPMGALERLKARKQ